MIEFFHTFIPKAILLDTGWFKIYYYGLIIAIAISVSLFITLRLGKKLGLKSDDIFDFSFLLILGGIIGARIYDIFLFLPYYINKPLAIFKIWEGGLAIHGGIIVGIIIAIIFAKKKNISFWKLSAIIAPALALGQAIGRFGNYFNQELFGKPSNLAWSIPIEILNRPPGYESFSHFHPTFIYESLGLFFIFIILIIYLKKKIKRKSDFNNDIFPLAFYMLSYSLLRFSLEFIKIDETPYWLGLRFPQIISLTIITLSLFFIIKTHVFPKKIQL